MIRRRTHRARLLRPLEVSFIKISGIWTADLWLGGSLRGVFEQTFSLSAAKKRMPLSVQVVLGAACGAALGVAFGKEPFLLGMGNEQLGKLGMLVIKLLKALAAPLILVAIVDAFVRTQFTLKQGLRLIRACAVNATVACTIGLVLMNLIHPGNLWRGQLDKLLTEVPHQELRQMADVSLDPIDNLAGYVPESFVEPLLKNTIISIVLAGVLLGAALRRLQQQTPDDPGVKTLVGAANASFRVLVQILEWVVALAPYAVLGATADAVGRNGLSVLQLLFPFVGILLLGMAIHALIYYPFIAWAWGKRTPREYLLGCSDAALTGLSCNSSLATVPVTLKCLTEKMGVSESSSRLAACVGTNLNNDGITMYECMTAVFLAQALNTDLGLSQQLGIVMASIMAGIGMAGVPEAGLIVLPLVLGSSGLPPAVVTGIIPLIMPVDWLIGRARTGVNVMSDMVVAVMLDADQDKGEALQASLPPSIHEGQIEEIS